MCRKQSRVLIVELPVVSLVVTASSVLAKVVRNELEWKSTATLEVCHLAEMLVPMWCVAGLSSHV